MIQCFRVSSLNVQLISFNHIQIMNGYECGGRDIFMR